MKKLSLVFFIIWLFFPGIKGLFAITPDDVIVRAFQFANLHWYCDSNNIVSPHDPTYRSEFTVGWHYGEAYKWGGYDDESQFTYKIDKGYAAGYPWNDRVVDWACGIDCSGLVSRCWALAWKHATYHLDGVSSPIPWDSLKKGDILLKPGSHVIIFYYWISPGYSFWGIDASVAVYPARVESRPLDIDDLRDDDYRPKRYVNFVIQPDIPPSGHMTWGEIKALFAGSWSDETGFWSYGKFYSRGPYGTEAFNGRSLFWNNFDPGASGYVAFKSLPTNSDYFPLLTTASKAGSNGEFLDSFDLNLLATQSDFYYGDPLYNGGGAPYFYRVASYVADPFQLNYYSDQLYTKSIGIGMDSVAKYSEYNPWSPHFELATINGHDYMLFPSMRDYSIAIYDVTDIRNRQKVTELPYGGVMDVAVKDTLCFVLNPWGPDDYWTVVRILNVADPTNPISVSYLIIYNFYPLKIEVGNQSLFVFCTDPYYHEDQFIIKVDISDPANPIEKEVIQVGNVWHKANDMIVAEPYVYVSREGDLRIHRCENLGYVTSYPLTPVDTLTYHSIDYQNGKIYTIQASPNGSFTNFFLDIIDVADPANPFLVSSTYIFELTPLDFPYQGGICVQGDYVYLNAFTFLSIFDVSNVNDVYLTERIKPCVMVAINEISEILEHGDIIVKGNKVFGLFAPRCCEPHYFSGFYTAQTFGLETDVILIGDANADGRISLADVIYLANYLLSGGPAPFPLSLGEVNADGRISLGDVIYLANYLFKGGPAPTKIYVGPSEYKASLTFTKFEVNTDNTLDLSIFLETDGPVAGVELEIDYDSNKIELLPPVLTANTQNMDLFYSKDCKKIGILDLEAKNLIPKGQILNLTIKNKGLSDSIDLRIRIKDALVFDPQGRELEVEIFNSISSSSSKPKEFQLSQNYPNPFNPTTVIEYILPFDCQVKLTIYNILGQKVKKLVDRYQKSGYQRLIWDGLDESGARVASGIYFYKLEAGGFVQAKKMNLLK